MEGREEGVITNSRTRYMITEEVFKTNVWRRRRLSDDKAFL